MGQLWVSAWVSNIIIMEDIDYFVAKSYFNRQLMLIATCTDRWKVDSFKTA